MRVVGKHWAVALGLSVGFVALLLNTSDKIGYARDEGFYFQAAASYEAWFSLLFLHPSQALHREVVARYWQVNSEHPALMKSLFALSHHFLYAKWHWFATAGEAFRFPAMLISALGVGVLYLWGTETIGAFAALTGALLLGFMPQVFHHAHLACFDMPVAALSLMTAYAYWKSLRHRRLFGALGVGLLYGLFLNTKHNAWLFPLVVLAHFALLNHQVWLSRVSNVPRKLRFPPALLAMLVLGPLTLYAAWPWLWFETLPRLMAYAKFHLGHEYYNMEFLGRTYWKPPMPLGYAWVMTLATVPLVTLALFTVGLVNFARSLLPRNVQCAGVLRGLGSKLASIPFGSPKSAQLLWLLGVAVNYAPWWSSQTPIFGGTKHWLTAYPFLCLLAGVGVRVIREKAQLLARSKTQRQVLSALLFAALLLGPISMTWHSVPFGLSAYTPIVGGASGAANLGLNRTFWGYTSRSLFNEINALAPPGARIYVHDTALQSFEQHQQEGGVRPDLEGTLDLAHSNLALYQHEPHMARVEYQIWSVYGTVRPAAIQLFDGVPVVWLYRRP